MGRLKAKFDKENTKSKAKKPRRVALSPARLQQPVGRAAPRGRPQTGFRLPQVAQTAAAPVAPRALAGGLPRPAMIKKVITNPNGTQRTVDIANPQGTLFPTWCLMDDKLRPKDLVFLERPTPSFRWNFYGAAALPTRASLVSEIEFGIDWKYVPSSKMVVKYKGDKPDDTIFIEESHAMQFTRFMIDNGVKVVDEMNVLRRK